MKTKRAFTLVELLIALALTSGLAVLLMSVVAGAANVWQQARNQIDTYAGARQMLGRIADEIKGATASNGRVEFSENITGSSFTSGGTSPQAVTSENVFFVAPYPNSAAGDLCVIAYRLNNNTHELQRAFVKSDDAWNIGTSRYRVGATYTYTWQTIARGVLEFELRCYSQQDLDNNQTPADTWNSESGTSPIAGNVPRRVILRAKITDEKSLARLSVAPAGTAYNRIVAQSARDFYFDVSLVSPH